MSRSGPSLIRRTMLGRQGHLHHLKRALLGLFLVHVATAEIKINSIILNSVSAINDTSQSTRSPTIKTWNTSGEQQMQNFGDHGTNQQQQQQHQQEQPQEQQQEQQQEQKTSQANDLSAKIRHLRQKVRLKESASEEHMASGGVSAPSDGSAASFVSSSSSEASSITASYKKERTKTVVRASSSWLNVTGKNTYRLLASGSRKMATPPAGNPLVAAKINLSRSADVETPMLATDRGAGAPNLQNKLGSWSIFGASTNDSDRPRGTAAGSIGDFNGNSQETVVEGVQEEELDESISSSTEYTNAYAGVNSELDDASGPAGHGFQVNSNLDVMTKFLRIIESSKAGNCSSGTDETSMETEGMVDKYAQERFRLEATVAVNRANWLTRVWKYADRSVLDSEYLLHVNLYSIIEMDEDIFAAGNCYDKFQYKDYVLFCPFAYREPNGSILAKDLAVAYNYVGTESDKESEWFFKARENAKRVITNMTSLTKAYHTSYTARENGTKKHTDRFEDEILSVSYEDGKWSKPYFDCGGGNIWMMTYTVPFFGYSNGTYFFKGTSGIDIDLRRVDIDQCPSRAGNTQLNIFAGSAKCKNRTTKCTHIPGLGFRRGSYRCECKEGFYFPEKNSPVRYYNGTVIEEEYEKKLMGVGSVYDEEGTYECLPCPEGCEICEDDSPCIVTLNWVMRTTILILEIIVICCLPAVALFTWRYGHIKVVRAASPALLRLIILGAFFIYCTTLVAYFPPNRVNCSLRVWLREIGFSFAYGALMLKTWRISVIFRVRSAKAVKITDLDLIKRLGIILAIFTTFLAIRTMVEPPHVIVARTADDLKAYICQTDWWDHVFTAMEIVLLVWGIRLCIVVRKAPSEFNESRFISMAIYNEFLLSIFLNVSMLFLQSPANPDLMYIIMFSHTQLTTTLLLVLIFGSKAYLVLRGRGKGDDIQAMTKPQAAKFLAKSKNSSHNATSSRGSNRDLDIPGLHTISDPEIQEEIRRIVSELDQLKEKTTRAGQNQVTPRLATMLQVARQTVAINLPAPSTSSTAAMVALESKGGVGNATCQGSASDSGALQNGPTTNGSGASSELRQRKSQTKGAKYQSPRNSPDSGLGGYMFGSLGGPHVNNVLACMTDKIVCATFGADPNTVLEDDEDQIEVETSAETAATDEDSVDQVGTHDTPDVPEPTQIKPRDPASMASLDRQAGAARCIAPIASLALAAAPLLSFSPGGMAILRNCSEPNSRRNSFKPECGATPTGTRLSFVGDYTNCGALGHSVAMTPLATYTFNEVTKMTPASCPQTVTAISTTSLCTPTISPTQTDGTLSILSGQLATAERSLSTGDDSTRLPDSASLCTSPCTDRFSRTSTPEPVTGADSKRWSYPLSPRVVRQSMVSPLKSPNQLNALTSRVSMQNVSSPGARRAERRAGTAIEVDCTVQSAQSQATPGAAAPAPAQDFAPKSRTRINTDDRDRFTEEVTV